MAGMLIAFVIGAASIASASAGGPYPNRPIRIVVPFGPGGFADITVRLLAQKLTERTNAQVVIENRPGAGGVIAGNVVTSAEPDGYTLFVFSSGIALSKSLLKSMPFDPVTAFAPISTMAQFDLLLLVRADSPMHTLKEALDAARADPQKFNVGTINPGSTQNVTGELLRSVTGIPMTVVPHRTSAEVLTALLRGDMQIGIESYAALKSAIDAGQIRALASSGNKRSPQQPDVPTLRESGIDAAMDGWNSLVAPAGTPRDIIAFLNGHLRAIIGDPDFQKRMIALGGGEDMDVGVDLETVGHKHSISAQLGSRPAFLTTPAHISISDLSRASSSFGDSATGSPVTRPGGLVSGGPWRGRYKWARRHFPFLVGSAGRRLTVVLGERRLDATPGPP
jgi:tripartite-type tricarboxylate transporter receptor subunit TctC